MKNIGICSEANFDANGAHCFFPSLEETVYIPAKFTCFIKNLLCGNCITESKVSYNQKSCVEAAPVGAKDISEPYEWQLFPNPAEKDIQLHVSFRTTQCISIELLDITGKKLATLFSGTVGPGAFSEQMTFPEGICKGFYLVRINSENYHINKKIFIQ
ncbi:MAG: T9SS type A sorting domain-containing protein [Bacteroidetes bacterium]|nr:T9SS type A sorting domain-containing protein [Bacteroidota bacterium]